jgi:hypothetical protein
MPFASPPPRSSLDSELRIIPGPYVLPMAGYIFRTGSRGAGYYIDSDSLEPGSGGGGGGGFGYGAAAPPPQPRWVEDEDGCIDLTDD